MLMHEQTHKDDALQLLFCISDAAQNTCLGSPAFPIYFVVVVARNQPLS
jgi:hypothetical protein